MAIGMKLSLAFAATASALLSSNPVHGFSTLPTTSTRTIVPTIASTTTTKRTTTTSLQARGRPDTIKVQRDWTYVDDKGEEYQSKGKMTVKVFTPKNNDDNNTNIKGCAFFMHGFSQYTKAYSDTLQRVADHANVAVISVDTGITSILGDVITNPFGPKPPFLLQRKLSQDTMQCIRMIMDGSEDFKEFGIGKNVPMGVCGHSMGGGLSFPVSAAFPKINYVFTMAPVAGESAFDPITKGIDIKTANNSMNLAGTWDLIARPKKVKAFTTAANEKKKDSSIFVSIDKGLHTGFEDKLVITNIGLTTILRLVFGLFSAIDNIFLFLAGILRTSTGQLEGSELLMEFFFDKMAKGQKVSVKDAEKYLDDNMDKKFDKFDFN